MGPIGNAPLFCPECEGALPPSASECPDCGTSIGSERDSLNLREELKATESAQVLSQNLPDWFPFDQLRQGQGTFIDAVQQAVEEGDILLAQAPTGLGKTVGVLTSTLAKTVRENLVAGYLVPKQAQHRPPGKTLKFFEDNGLRTTALDVISKQDMCPKPESEKLGHDAFQAFCYRVRMNETCDYSLGTTTPVFEALSESVHDVEEFVSLSHDAGICPYKVFVNHREESDVLILDYNHFFRDEDLSDAKVRLLNRTILVIDEAHNLLERLRQHLRYDLTPKLLGKGAEELGDLGYDAEAETLRHLAEWLESEIQAVWRELGSDDRRKLGETATKKSFHEALVHSIDKGHPLDSPNIWKFVTEIQDALEETGYRGVALEHVIAFVERWMKNEPDRVRYWYFPDRDERLDSGKLVVEDRDISKITRPVFDEAHAVVMMSATLQPFDMYANLLDIPSHRRTSVSLPNPFPEENRTVRIDRDVTSRYGDRGPTMYREFAERIEVAHEHTPGHVAVFFPSYAFQDSVVDKLGLRSEEVLQQTSGMSKETLEALVEDLRSSEEGKVLAGVLATGISEGYDLTKGSENLLKTILIAGIPYPPPTVRQDLIRNFVDDRFPGKGYQYVAEIPAIRRVLQALGRAIRASSHRAFIGLLDHRYESHRVRPLIDERLHPEITEDLGKDIYAFHHGR